MNNLTPKKNISRAIWNLIQQHGVPTGSRIFGGAFEESDHDYIIPPDFPISMNDLLLDDSFFYDQSYNYDDTFRSIKGYYQGNLLNLLIMWRWKNYQCWVRATEVMEDICKNPLVARKIQDKKTRVRLFEALKEVFS